MSDKYSASAALQALRDWVLGKLAGKQDTLVSGTNIKTINSESLLGSGDVDIHEGLIDSISVNGTAQTIDADKNVDLTVPEKIYIRQDDFNWPLSKVIEAIDGGGVIMWGIPTVAQYPNVIIRTGSTKVEIRVLTQDRLTAYTVTSSGWTGPTLIKDFAEQADLAAKQDALTFDTAPTSGSSNPVTSDGIKSYVDAHSGGGASPSDASPLMDGTAAPGTSAAYARGDHVHPADTSKLNVDGGNASQTGFELFLNDGPIILDTSDQYGIEIGSGSGITYIGQQSDDTTVYIHGLADPINDNDATPKSYVDSLDRPFTAIYGATTYAELTAALSADRAVIVKDVPYNGDTLTMLVNWWEDTGSAVEIESITTAQGDLCDCDITATSADAWTSTFVSRDPFMLLDFSQKLSINIPVCTSDVANTGIPNIDVAINDTLGADWAIASLAKFEVYDAATGGNRINCWPVCQFSMNGQKTLRLRMMCAGTSAKAAGRIQGAILLKHR